jgi:hypothetical protein
VLRLFHRTRRTTAAFIRAKGFCDGESGLRDSKGEVVPVAGVWFSDRPLDSNEDAWGDVLLTLEVAERHIRQFEVLDQASEERYRKWCIPAAVVNAVGRRLRAIDGRTVE